MFRHAPRPWAPPHSAGPSAEARYQPISFYSARSTGISANRCATHSRANQSLSLANNYSYSSMSPSNAIRHTPFSHSHAHTYAHTAFHTAGDNVYDISGKASTKTRNLLRCPSFHNNQRRLCCCCSLCSVRMSSVRCWAGPEIESVERQ